MRLFKAYLCLMRFDKPVGFYLLLWPTLAALCLAHRGLPSFKLLIIFTLGVIVMRAFGCVMNDIADRRFDGHVARTKIRPLPSGILSTRQALYLALGLLLLAFSLVLFLNRLTLYLSFVGAFLAILYPFMKRYTHYAQGFLGLAFNWGIPMAFAATRGSLPMEAWVIYLIAFIWSVIYDTQYAMVDREDDLQIGIKSTAILFAGADRLMIAGMQGVLLVLLFALAGYYQMHGWYYTSVLITTGFFGYQQWLIKDRDPTRCFKAFLNNHWAWLSIFLGIFLHFATL